LGGELEITGASQPSDIIWENRHVTKRKKSIKRVAVMFMIIVLLTISAGIIYGMSTISMKLKNKYPKINCDNIYKVFIGNYGTHEFRRDRKNWRMGKLLEERKDIEEFMFEAVREF
jgi:hypothetical protein